MFLNFKVMLLKFVEYKNVKTEKDVNRTLAKTKGIKSLITLTENEGFVRPVKWLNTLTQLLF